MFTTAGRDYRLLIQENFFKRIFNSADLSQQSSELLTVQISLNIQEISNSADISEYSTEFLTVQISLNIQGNF